MLDHPVKDTPVGRPEAPASTDSAGFCLVPESWAGGFVGRRRTKKPLHINLAVWIWRRLFDGKKQKNESQIGNQQIRTESWMTGHGKAAEAGTAAAFAQPDMTVHV